MTGWVVFWIALFVIFGVGEAWTRAWRLWPFALAAALAGGAAVFDVSVGLQWSIYALAAALLPFAANRLLPRAPIAR